MAKTLQVRYLRSKDVEWITERISPMTFYLHNQMGGKGWRAGRAGINDPAYYWFERDSDLTLFLLSRPIEDIITDS